VNHLPPTAAVVVAGGRGVRFGSPTPKQFLDLGGEPVLHHSLRAFEACEEIGSIVVVVPDAPYEGDLRAFPKVIGVVGGGRSRQASVGEGLAAVPVDAGVVVVHDAVRPLVRPDLISRVLGGLEEEWDGVFPAIGVSEATKEVGEAGELVRSFDRRGLLTAQTPQAARRAALEEAFVRASADGWESEDCSEMLARSGFRVRAVEGDPLNVKITRPVDLEACRRVLDIRAAEEMDAGRTRPGSR
jgi:2-C-methyl-D-erythritol 4-phosphate cytidylyltransferase